ncbi:hypothetical protein C8A01DRAFT_42566 [Parachaetomium inaequale]|uniref:Uncharacterized protein n=1 Tax=Parachaetomium inaequale TaxID=2588326 RepID=A0AAN6PP68_9PEZI|nr:hypothetical protein C8A01DRAFT_42566 [Parachaetomium inaequale]
MEPQTTESPPPTEPRTSNVRSGDTTPPRPEQLSFSVPALRFPRPEGSQLLANWVSNSAPDIRQPSTMLGSGNEADSAYDFITDTESQDDRLTESTCSLTAPRPEDVHSLDGSVDQYHTDSDEESDQSSHASSIRYADQVLQNPSTQLPTGSLEHGSSAEGSGVVVGSIQFQESGVDDPVLVETIPAIHAIREFSEEESSAIAQDLAKPNPPRRLAATIRQTMSQSYLSTQEPLRVLYVGRPEAQRSIVLKICSAIWASPHSNDQDYFSRHREGVYNIVPISSFGPAPELDLMEASQYQIKVEHCTSAVETGHQGGSSLGDGSYTITIEQDKSYRSFSSPSGSVVEPKWDLPHIAVFYCSERDDVDADTTKHCAWSFMQRHGVPSIFIADQQNFRDARWGEYIDEHTVHVCLESRDSERPTAPQRFPIDYASFADIDARQMNRNLAYLTGLSETEDSVLEGSQTNAAMPDPEPEVWAALNKSKRAWRRPAGREEFWRWFWAVLPMVLLLTGPFFLHPMIDWLSGGLSNFHPLSSTGVCVSSPTYPGFTTGRSSSVATSTKTVVINVTSTKTVQVSETQPSTSTLASALSFAGFLSDKPSAVPADTEAKNKKPTNPTKMVCSVRVFSPTEVLVAIPSRNKAVWLAQGAIDIAVRRNDDPIKTKISSVDEGVLVELERKDAHGVLNVTVVTTRRPKINETFQIDFGKSTVAEVAEALEEGLHMLQDAIKKLPWTDGALQFFENARRLPQDVRKLPREAVSALEHASEAVRDHAAGTVKRAKENAREHLDRQLKSAETIRKEVDLSVLQAQIASRLWWLKVQGRTEEYTEYERNASRLLKMKHEELLNSRECKKNSPKEPRPFYGFRSGLYSPRKKDCSRRDERGDSQDGWEHKWRKLMRGM